MNANKMLCKPRFLIFDANAFFLDADAKCPYDAYISFSRCNFHDADVLLGVCCDADVLLWVCHDLVYPYRYAMMRM